MAVVARVFPVFGVVVYAHGPKPVVDVVNTNSGMSFQLPAHAKAVNAEGNVFSL
ncbi:MAG: hypothetical protein H6765_01765 [Candidatus Peribacteria bacterium]|nr:MAG: hypothetical protein H6765_01765 [Candidatus Peribacteria bacterium]